MFHFRTLNMQSINRNANQPSTAGASETVSKQANTHSFIQHGF